jgi:hypothetical protein
VSYTRCVQTDPDAYYGKEVTLGAEFEGLELIPGDMSHERGFAIRERGDKLSCLVFTAQIAADPLTQSFPLGMGD